MLPLLACILLAAPLAAAGGPAAQVQLRVDFEGEDLARPWLLPKLSDGAIAAESGTRVLRLLTAGGLHDPLAPTLTYR